MLRPIRFAVLICFVPLVFASVVRADGYRLDIGASVRDGSLKVEQAVAGPAGKTLRYEITVRRDGQGGSSNSSQAGGGRSPGGPPTSSRHVSCGTPFMARTPSQQGHIDRLTKTAHQTVERAADAATSAVERAGEKAEAIYEMQQGWVESGRDYVREHPFAVIGMAFAAGYLYRMLSRR